MTLLGMPLERPTLTSITRAGVIATVVMLLLLLVHQVLASPLTGLALLMWWTLCFWAAGCNAIGIRLFRALTPTLIVLAGDLVIIVVFSLIGPV